MSTMRRCGLAGRRAWGTLLALVVFVGGGDAVAQPKTALAWNNLGVEQVKQGHLPEALVSLNQAVAIAPDYSPALENRADVYVRLARANYEKVAADGDPQARERARHKLAPRGVPPRLTFTQGDLWAAVGMVKAWAREWSAGNWTGYRGYYDATFRPPAGRSIDAWEADRHARLAGRIEVRVTPSDIEVMQGDDGAVACRFVLTNVENGRSVQGRRVLRLVLRPEGWRIAGEESEPVPGL